MSNNGKKKFASEMMTQRLRHLTHRIKNREDAS